MEDPNLQWDGTRWLRWDGHNWVDATTGQPTVGAPSDPVGATAGATAGRTSNMWVGIAIGALVVLLVIAIVVIGFFVLRPNDPAPTTSPTPVPTVSAPSTSAPATPVVPSTYTLYFVNTEFPGGVYGAGVRTRGNQASGFVGTMQSGDLGCFNGTYSGGYLTGTLVIPPDGGGAPATQPFKWPVSGEGESFRLVAIGEVTPLREVPLATMNDYGGKGASESWQPLFTSCAKLTGGLS